MKKVAVLIENLFEESELLYPYYRLIEEGYEVHLVGSKKDTVYKGSSGSYTMKSTHASKDIKASDYQGVVIPGGYSPDYMRRNDSTKSFIKDLNKDGKVIAAICHGPWMLASCFDLDGRDLTSYFSIKDDLINAGANYKDEEVVIDKNFITSRSPKDLPAWLKAIIKGLKDI